MNAEVDYGKKGGYCRGELTSSSFLCVGDL